MENLKKEIQKVINLYELHKFPEAEELGKKILHKNSKISFIYNLLGLICAAQNKNDEAIKYYNEGINIEPKNSVIYNNLGTAYKSKKKYNESEKYYKKSILINNKLPEAYNNLANLYNQLNKQKEAIKLFNEVIKKKPDFYVAHYNLGILYKNIGEFDKSKKHLAKATNLYKNFFSAHRAYSQINKYKKSDDSHIILMKKIYNDDSINIRGKSEMAFALGKAYDDTNNYDEAFKFYKEGNHLRRSVIDFSLNREKEEFNYIKSLFTKNFFNENKNLKFNNSTPIFILGMPRSGTTLVEQIISSHPSVYGGDELSYFNDLIKENFYENKNLIVKNNIKEKFNIIYKTYIKNIRKLSSKKSKITDKLPINFKWIGFIKLIFPNSKIIHCKRNSKDTCVSIYKNYFTNTELNYAYDLSELVDFYKIYENLMNFWKKNLPDFFYEVEYEKLIENPNQEIKKLIKKCDLKWNEKCLMFYNNKRSIKTASDTQVRKKIYKTSKDSWKNYERYLNEYMKNL